MAEKRPQTLEEIEKLPKEMLIVTDICGYMDIDPDVIRWQARNNPEALGFPVIVAKSRIKIPKEGFIDFCRKGRRVVLDYELITEVLAIKISQRMAAISS